MLACQVAEVDGQVCYRIVCDCMLLYDCVCVYVLAFVYVSLSFLSVFLVVCTFVCLQTANTVRATFTLAEDVGTGPCGCVSLYSVYQRVYVYVYAFILYAGHVPGCALLYVFYACMPSSYAPYTARFVACSFFC